ncbi:MAG: sigma-70 family RNA polymerase sigma factor [Spirochaetes bacterium]|nr:sigma-70 family RNA polymerase sigma factor [Spirochaetota bacterium]
MKGDTLRQAIAEYFRAERERMVGYVRRLIDDAADMDGEDIVQEVMARLLDMEDLTVSLERFGAYIYRALKNRVIDVLRLRKPSVSLDGGDRKNGELSMAGLLGDLRYDAVAEMEKADMCESLFRAIDALAPEQREIIYLTEFEGRSYREIAEQTGIPLGTLLARKSRAIARVRESMACHYDQWEEYNV